MKPLQYMIDHPRLFGLASMTAMWLLAWLGAWLRERFHTATGEEKDSLGLVVSAALTLLGLIISFTFSLAAGRYDQRRLFEEEEANAIGTEYVRADLLSPPQGALAKRLLAQYLDRRVLYYQTGYGSELNNVDAETAQLQGRLWQSILPDAAANPNPVTAIVVSGMNDVLNRQGYTQFAWWNRIPESAWALLLCIALVANLLLGYATKRSRSGNLLLLVLPILVSVSLFLIADIDSPRGGLIRIPPRDLIALQQSLR